MIILLRGRTALPATGGGGPTPPAFVIGGGSSVSAIVRYPFCHVDVDGVQIPIVFSFRCSHGYDLMVAEATVSVPVVPFGIKPWSVLGIFAGANQGSAAIRFNGFVVGINYALWPREAQLLCRGPLVRAQLEQCSIAGGVDLSAGGAGQTDQAIVQQLLSAAGATVGGPIPLNIGGLGRTLGTVATTYYTWAENQSALAMIQELDKVCLGWRTFDTPSGGIARVKISSVPATTAALVFTEGVDIFSASPETGILDTKTRVQVTGYDDGTGGGPVNYTIHQSNPLMPLGDITDQISSNLIESNATGGTGIAAQEVAEWWLGEVNRAMGKYTFVTPRDDQIAIGMTITINAPNRLGISQNFWVQHVDPQLTQTGEWSQQIIALAGLTGFPGSGQSNTLGTPSGGVIDNGGTGGATGGTGGDGGGPSSGGSQGNPPPTNTPPTVDFTVEIQSEQVLIAGVATTLYDIQATASAVGTSAPVVTYSWSFPDGSITTGTAITFVSTVTAITGSSILTLTVTDTAGNAASVAHTIQQPATGQIVSRQLYLAGGNCMEAYDGASWQTQTESSLLVVGNGPVWADDAGDVYSSPDSFTTIFDSLPPIGRVNSLWIETDVSTTRVLAGGDNGAVALSVDSGITWVTAPANPSGSNAVRKVGISRANPNQWFALTDGALYRSDNAGNGWVVVAAATGGERCTDVAFGFARLFVALAGGRRLIAIGAGGIVTQTLPVGMTGDPLAIAPHIRKDACYVLDTAGNTAAHAQSGDSTLAAGATLPSGTPQARGLWRDGKVVDLLYIAAGEVGVYKSIDGMRTSGGYFPIRQPGVGTSPSGAYYTMVGADGTLGVATITPTTKYSTPGAERIHDLGSSGYVLPAGWTLPAFVDSGWDTSHDNNSTETFGGGALLSGATWVTYAAAVGTDVPGSEEFLLRKTFSLPAGKITSAVLTYAVDVDLLECYVNGTWVAGNDFAAHYTATTTVIIPPALLLPGSASNVLALRVRNGFSVPTLHGTMGVIFQVVVS